MTAVTLNRHLEELSQSLIDLHRSLLHLEQRRHEQTTAVGPSASPLDLVLFDPSFAWLRTLSGLVVEVDERLSEGRPIAITEAAAFRSRTEARFDAGLSERLSAAVQESPQVAIGLGRVRMALAQLPQRGQALA